MRRLIVNIKVSPSPLHNYYYFRIVQLLQVMLTPLSVSIWGESGRINVNGAHVCLQVRNNEDFGMSDDYTIADDATERNA
jgi:hypothetical protein